MRTLAITATVLSALPPMPALRSSFIQSTKAVSVNGGREKGITIRIQPERQTCTVCAKPVDIGFALGAYIDFPVGRCRPVWRGSPLCRRHVTLLGL